MPRIKTTNIAEFGDFQTPAPLAARACGVLRAMGVRAASVVEPTCGRGAFVFAASDCWPSARVTGHEINAEHLSAAHQIAGDRKADNIRFFQSDFFGVNWSRHLRDLPSPLLIVGNPPWVTNSHLGSLGSSNLPAKSNFQGHDGFDAITGKANFDISEWMLIQLAKAIGGRDAVLAMLVKTVVARKVLRHCWNHDLPVIDAKMFQIDASAHFDAAVDATFLVMRFAAAPGPKLAAVYGQLSLDLPPTTTIGLASQTIVADLKAYERTKHLNGGSPLKWRSGIKHDCSKVMELLRVPGGFRNGFGEVVGLEPDFLLPMLKTSEVANGNEGKRCTRFMIVPQRRINGDTGVIERQAPETWRYLQSYRHLLDKRGSSIYRGKPPFAIFGVGEYSFAPWKIAISGMYKSLRFTKIGTCGGQPIMLDDVTNFLPCASEHAADLVMALLTSDLAKAFFSAHVFWDAKRPITVELLGRLNLHALASEMGVLSEFSQCLGGAATFPARKSRHDTTPASMPMLW